MSRPGFSLIPAPYHDKNLLLDKSGVPLRDLKMLKLPGLATCGQLTPMVPGGFILMLLLPLCPMHYLLTSLKISILNGDMFQSPCPHLTVVVFAFFGVSYGWVGHRIVQTLSSMPKCFRSTYCKYFRPLQSFNCEWQKSCFRPSTVGLPIILCHQILKRRGIFTNPLEYWWWIWEVRRASFICRTSFSLFYRVFPRVLFLFNRVFLFFAHVFLHAVLSPLAFLLQLSFLSSPFIIWISSIRVLISLSVIFTPLKDISFLSRWYFLTL